MGRGQISKGVVKDIIIVVIAVIIIWAGLRLIFGTENPFFVVSSGSMVPELQIFDVLVVNGNTPFNEIKVGDIIVFNRPGGQERVIVHRVNSIIDDDPYTIRTKGDANPASIPGTDFPITENEYIGEVYTVIPQVGYITRILTPPINYIIIAVIVSIMILKQVSKSKKEKKLATPSTLDSQNEITESENSINYNELSEMPSDTEYVEPSDKNKKFDKVELGKNPDGIDNPSTDSTEKKSEE